MTQETEQTLSHRPTRWVFHIDMDAFYASVEQYRIHPELKGKPVCVGVDPRKGSGRGVVMAASYAARAFGVRSAMPVSEALRLCPTAVFVRGPFSNYREASNEFMEVLREFADGNRVRRASIDEAYIEVTQRVQDYSSPKALAQEIQKQVLLETKLPCSIGIAPNMAVAKIATDMNKPRGITFVPQDPQQVADFLAPLKVNAVSGIGKATSRHLERYGIRTLGQIQKLSIPELIPIMGKSAKWLYNRAWGVDDRPLRDNGPHIRKSMSKDRTFMEDVPIDKLEPVQEMINDLSNRIGQRLQEKNLFFRTVTVKIRFSDFTTIQRSKSVTARTNDAQQLRNLATQLIHENLPRKGAIRLIGVKVSNLTTHQTQGHLDDFL